MNRLLWLVPVTLLLAGCWPFGKDDEVNRFGLKICIRKCRAGGGKRQVGGQFTVGRNMPRLDAGARGYPLVAGIDDVGEIGIAEYTLRQIRPAAPDDGTNDTHEFAAFTMVLPGPISPAMLSKRS